MSRKNNTAVSARTQEEFIAFAISQLPNCKRSDNAIAKIMRRVVLATLWGRWASRKKLSNSIQPEYDAIELAVFEVNAAKSCVRPRGHLELVYSDDRLSAQPQPA